MTQYSHQFLIAVTVQNDKKDPAEVTERELIDALACRSNDIFRHDGIEAFQHNDTEEV